MKIYRYDENTFEFIQAEEAIKNIAKSRRTGKDEWLMPAFCTAELPLEAKPGFTIVFNKDIEEWEYKEDHRGETVYDKTTYMPIEISTIGELPENTTHIAPDHTKSVYQKFDEDLQQWIYDEAKKPALLETIWNVQKQLREQACEADLEYNGYLFHVDKTSFNDIMLAFQNAVFQNDMETKRRWVCANGDTEVSGADLAAILQLYGARREQLVFQSNDTWREDTEKTMEELMQILTALTTSL